MFSIQVGYELDSQFMDDANPPKNHPKMLGESQSLSISHG